MDVYQILRDKMQFKGVIMTDDLDMGAVSHIDTRYVTALQAGNDLLLVTDYNSAFTSLYEAIQSNEISIETLNQAVSRVLHFKYQLHFIN